MESRYEKVFPDCSDGRLTTCFFRLGLNKEVRKKYPWRILCSINWIGDWEIKDWGLVKQGQWQAGQGADWNWYKILDGQAIQDDWIAPSLSQPTGSGKRQYGTNIRIYNPKKKQWEMAWMSSNGKKLDTFSAKEHQNKIVMTGFYAGSNSRITFFNISANSFDWKLEMQQKDQSWLESYRIKGIRKK